MNYDKIQIELLKMAYNNDKKLITSGFNYKVDPEHMIILQEHYAVIVPKNRWFLDIEKVFNNKPPITLDVKRLTENAVLIRDSYVSKTDLNGRQLRIFKNDDNESIYVDEKLLKIFKNDKYDKLHYRGSNPKSPVVIYNDIDECLGLVLPVKYMGADD